MNVRTIATWLMAGSLLIVGSCQKLEEDTPTGTGTVRTSINGSVVRSDDGSVIPGAIIQDLLTASKRDTTDTQGLFSIPYDLDQGQTYTTSLFARLGGFGNDTINVSLRAGVDTTVTLTLRADSSSPQSGATSGQPASIVLIGTDVNTISIRGSGVNESALLTYEVRDSLGNPIKGTSPHTVKFSIVGGPGGAEYVFPTSARINATTGRVTTRLNSGTRPGVIQVQASTRNDSVLSSPARITIASGPPDGNNVSISRSKANVPGLVFDNERVRISVILGDRYQNPVPAGTAVYFTTSGGLVQATGKTDDDGIASVDLISAAPRPGNGIVTVRARTIGDTAVRKADSLIERQINVTFSGRTTILTQTAPILLADSGNYLLRYEVQDPNGNPIEGGSNVSVTLEGPAAGELRLTGDSEYTTLDTDDTTTTNRSVRIEDNTRGGLQGLFTVKISVRSRNGDASTSVAGFLQSTGGGGVSAGPTAPRSITLQSISSRTLSVKGTGSNETSRLVFLVRDSLGNPIGNPLDPTINAKVTFSINPSGGLGGGEGLSTTLDSTGAQGTVGVTFNAGTRAGVLQIVASTPGSSGLITASPVQITIQGGLPDSNRFVTSLSRINLPGLIKTGPLGTVSVQAADEFGNPAQTGTAIYFSTSLGLVGASATLGEGGAASVNLSGGVVGPSSGAGTVTVQTVDKTGQAIRKYLPFLFTGATQITGLPANGFAIPDSGSYTFNYVVSDPNGNPLSGGSTITVSAEGAGAGDLTLSGDVQVVIPDRLTGFTNFSVTAIDKSTGGVSGPVAFRISVSSENGSASALHTGSVLAAGQSPSAGGGTRFASSIGLAETSTDPSRVLSVQGTGANETSILKFIVKDSLGVPVDALRAATVAFSIQGGPGGGEYVYPDTAVSDGAGNVYTTLHAGTASGVVQVRARAVVNGRVITSSPVVFTIAGGLPDSNRITVWTDRQNYPGLVQAGELLGNVFVQLGDKYGNPVQPGTAVYFTSTGGIIGASAFTSTEGRVSTPLYGGGQAPVQGQDTIRVTTVGENNTLITKRISVTFSGSPIVTSLSAPTDSVTIFDGGFFDLDFRLADVNGNPLSAGNSVSMSVTGTAGTGIALSGDANFTTIDTRSPAFTNFRVRLQDNVANGGVSGPFTLRIAVNGPNGSTTKLIYGTLGAPQAITPPSPTVKNPSQIAFIGISATDIFVSGVGALENTVVTYEVRDSLGAPIEANPRAYATFSINFFPNSFAAPGTNPRFIPSADSTDNAGRLRVSISSGTTAGVIQVVATVMVGATPITSLPVRITIHAGFPDQRHFTLSPNQRNFPGLGWRAFVEQTITVQVADKYSNPVQTGTAVYFHSQHGTMQTGGGSQGLTDDRGFVRRLLNKANPLPLNADSIALGQGWSYVYAQTFGTGGLQIIDSVLLLWTGDPIITLTGGPNPFAVANGGTVGPFTFTVKDFLNHPMSGGTSITVSATGGAVDGDAQIELRDTQSTGPGITDFTITLSDADDQDTDPPKPALLTVTVNHPVLGSFKRVIASGTID